MTPEMTQKKIKTQLTHHSWWGDDRCQNNSHDTNGILYRSNNFPEEQSSCPSYSSHDTLHIYSQIFVMAAPELYLYPAETEQMISQPAGGKVPPQWKHCSAWWNDDSKFVLTLQLVSGAYKIARPQMRDNSVAVSYMQHLIWIWMVLDH